MPTPGVHAAMSGVAMVVAVREPRTLRWPACSAACPVLHCGWPMGHSGVICCRRGCCLFANGRDGRPVHKNHPRGNCSTPSIRPNVCTSIVRDSRTVDDTFGHICLGHSAVACVDDSGRRPRGCWGSGFQLTPRRGPVTTPPVNLSACRRHHQLPLSPQMNTFRIVNTD